MTMELFFQVPVLEMSGAMSVVSSHCNVICRLKDKDLKTHSVQFPERNVKSSCLDTKCIKKTLSTIIIIITIIIIRNYIDK